MVLSMHEFNSYIAGRHLTCFFPICLPLRAVLSRLQYSREAQAERTVYLSSMHLLVSLSFCLFFPSIATTGGFLK